MSPRKKNSEETDEGIGNAPMPKKRAPVRKRAVPIATSRKTIILQTVPEAPKGGSTHPNHHVGLYRNIAVGFFVVTVLLFAAIFFTSVRKAEVAIAYTPEEVTYTDVVQVAPERIDGKTVAGVIEMKKVTVQKTFTPSGQERKEVPITGTVRIINNNTKDQPLVKTTRLLSPDGKLYHLAKSVVVPAGKEVAGIEVYADAPGPSFGQSAPTQFTIPGLWEPLQKKIFAKSDAPFAGGVQERGVVSTQDMQKAETEIREAIAQEASRHLQELKSKNEGSLDGLLVTPDALQIERQGDIGDSVASFTLKARANAVVVRYRAQELEQLIRARIGKLPVEEYAHLVYDPAKLTVRVESYDVARGQAQLSLFEQVRKEFKQDAAVFSPEQFYGKTAEEIHALFTGLPGADKIQVETSFFPQWVKRVPKVGGTVDVTVRTLEQSPKP